MEGYAPRTRSLLRHLSALVRDACDHGGRRPPDPFCHFVDLRPDPFSPTWWGFAPTPPLRPHVSPSISYLLSDTLSVVSHL